MAVLITVTVTVTSWLIASYCHNRLPQPVDTHSNTRFVAKYAKVCNIHVIKDAVDADIQYYLTETFGETDQLWTKTSWQL